MSGEIGSKQPIQFASQRVEDDRVDVELSVGAKSYYLRIDSELGVAVWGAREPGTILTDADVTSLLELTDAFSRDWPSGTTPDDLTDATQRFGLLLSEAPPELITPTEVVTPRGVETLEGEAPSSAIPAIAAQVDGDRSVDSSNIDECTTAAADMGAAFATTASGCQVADDDGIAYMNCTTANRTLYHDSSSHCFLSESVYSGPYSSDCLGGCGAGCSTFMTYSWDCGEHDRCGRMHGGSTNPWDSNCGDEYFDADDDVLYGGNKCRR